MSKTVKSLITNDYTQKFGSSSDAMVISIRGIKGIDVTKLRKTLRKNHVKITVIRNSLAKRMVKGSSLEKLEKFLSGPSALATGTSVVEVAREIVGLLKEFPGIELKGAVLDGTLFEGDKGVKELSKFPTRAEAIADNVTLLVGPGRKLAAQILGPGRTLGGIVKAIETKLEKGETIAKIA